MAALGLRLWVPRLANSTELTTHPKYYYRLHDWLLILPSALPVTGLSWLGDLCVALAHDEISVKPAEVTAAVHQTWDPNRIIDLGEWQGDQLNALQKRKIWQLISQ
ncbi:hypothetical protein IDSA_11880 [Pseudidiomarina salinarum]|uniref:Uncharacterized protein n=2 Tax=Pseudidiomarina salinarum TaxID=435908 RepID=A0A094L5Z0_9GAMM|nr:hypothetical protein IDSA_11880 [Pseudidiomarina salinarum]RUO68265.1 hypothetical protein CWI79_11865 [Pseudidiomarina salinarum]